MSKPFSALKFWTYGNEVLSVSNRLRTCLYDCAADKGNKDALSFSRLQALIHELHELLTREFDLPESYTAPPPPQDDIPF